MSNQMTYVRLEDLVPVDHQYRKFRNVWDFTEVEKELNKLKVKNNNEGYGIIRLFYCLLLQFMEDLSDRELERYLRENNTAKWFCDFELTESVSDHTVYGKARKKIGTKRLSKIFEMLRNQMRSKGYMSEVFTFVDASHLISKANLWEERDKVIKERYEKLNNNTLPKVAVDKQARIGCKGGNKFWYGYKKSVSVDMQSGLINKVSVNPGNVTDAKAFKHVCPNGGAVYADKGYCVEPAINAAKRKGVYLRAVKKNNMPGKNRELDRWITFIRSPYERVFTRYNKRVRYRGISKNQFAEFMNSICFNMRRIVVLEKGCLTG